MIARGRDGAIIGGAIGGAVGVAVATDEVKGRESPKRYEHVEYRHYPIRRSTYHFYPPGQAKKGRGKQQGPSARFIKVTECSLSSGFVSSQATRATWSELLLLVALIRSR